MSSSDLTGIHAGCRLCGSPATLLHAQLTDRLAGTAGDWNMLRCTDPQCGLAWLNPSPSAEQLAAAYETYYTHTVAGSNSRIRGIYNRMKTAYLAWRFGYAINAPQLWETIGGRLLGSLPHRRAAFDASVMWLPASSDGKVLEIGCGNGNLLAHLKSLGWRVQGVEPDPQAAEIAKSRGLPVWAGELKDDSFAPQSFDAIVMSHVIEHIGDPIELLTICRKILKPGGRLVMLTPNLDALGHRWFGRDWLHLDAPRHLHLFTRNSMIAACAQAGFADIACSTTLRDANWTLAGSLALMRGRHYRIGELSRPMRAAGFVMLYAEWLVLFFRRSRAEELLLVANSPAQA